MKHQTVAQFISDEFYKKKQKNSQLSIRSEAKKIGLSYSMLSMILKGQRRISIDTANKVSTWVNLDNDKRDFLFALVSYENSQIPIIKNQLSMLLENWLYCHEENLNMLVQRLIETGIERAVYNYKSTHDFSFRSLVLLKDKELGNSLPHFFDMFCSPERSASAIGYFLKNNNHVGQYSACFDRMLSGERKIEKIYGLNSNVRVNWNQEFPTISNVAFRIADTTHYCLGVMDYTSESFSVEGELLDINDCDFSKPYKLRYLRVP